MPLDLTYFGTLGRYLTAEEWVVVPTRKTKGTASCNAYTREILMLPKAYQVAHRPGRIRDYVLRHELAHAAHASLLSYDVDQLMQARKLTRAAAIEVVADRWCLEEQFTRPQMRRWVRASVIWHGKVGYRYTMRDVDSVKAAGVVTRMRDMLQMWEADRG
jgi:hypothetical protein